MSRLHLDLSWEEDEVEAEPPLRWRRNRGGSDDDRYLWFSTHVRPSDVVDAKNHRPKYEYTVTGRKRVKPGSRTTTLGTKVTVNGKTVAIFKYDDEFYAIQNACPHQAASLHLGDIEDIGGTLCISCPRHKWPFSLEDGQCVIPGAVARVDIRTMVVCKCDGKSGDSSNRIKLKWMSHFPKIYRAPQAWLGVAQDSDILLEPIPVQMGASQSTVQLHPVREPAALMSTGAGVIVRIPDSANGASTYEHNSRLSPASASIIRPDKGQSHIAVVRLGERNQALKGSIVYLKKAPRSSPHNP